MTSYSATLDYIFSRLPMFHRIGAAAYKANLNNTVELDKICGHPAKAIPCIHIAGTNGKGSVSNLIAAVLQSAGMKTGLFTSPHLRDFRERIRVNGQMITKSGVCRFVDTYKKDFDRIEPSFFEVTFAMAIWWFEQQKTDILVLETGMGGRLDSTNIVTPDLCIITNIGFDHMAFLGDSLEKIAAEKAGIIKAGIPVVIGEYKQPSAAIFQKKAESRNSDLYFADQECEVRAFRNRNQPPFHLEMDIFHPRFGLLKKIKTPLAGLYQLKNALTVVEALAQLQQMGYPVTTEALYQGFAKVKQLTGFKGRWQVLSTKPLTIGDTGHNIDGIREVVRQIRFTPHEQLHMVMGMVDDKDIASILEILPRHARYYFCRPAVPRGLDEKKLLLAAQELGLEGKAWSSVSEALSAAKKAAAPDDLIFVGGSTFVVAEVV